MHQKINTITDFFVCENSTQWSADTDGKGPNSQENPGPVSRNFKNVQKQTTIPVLAFLLMNIIFLGFWTNFLIKGDIKFMPVWREHNLYDQKTFRKVVIKHSQFYLRRLDQPVNHLWVVENEQFTKNIIILTPYGSLPKRVCRIRRLQLYLEPFR